MTVPLVQTDQGSHTAIIGGGSGKENKLWQ